jgi:Holliday junction resolvasome RuvABC endonuclease subunit
VSDVLRLVSADPGFANIGFAIVDLLAIGGADLVATKLVTTTPSKKKITQHEDEKQRLEEIEDAFIAFIDEHNPTVMVTEEPGKCLMRRNIGGKVQWQTNPKLLRTSCLMWGSIHGICRSRGIYCVSVGSQAIKKTLCNKKNASKADVIAAVKSRFPGYTKWPKSKKVEHVADAVGAAITGFTDPAVMVMLKRLRSS